MRDPDLIVRAQLAASALEGAWHRWRLVHGDVADPVLTVSSYVGYSLQEPWGQPRVVFGLAAEDAEQLAAFLERCDYTEPAYAAAGAQPGVRDLSARTPARDVTVPVQRRAPAAALWQAPPPAARKSAGQSSANMLLAGENAGYDEPLYRQVAAAMKEAAGARDSASRTTTEDAEPAHMPASRDNGGSAPQGTADPVIPSDRPKLADLVSPAWMGSLAMAASTARAEAEARIRAALTKPGDEPTELSAFDADADECPVAADERPGDDDGRGTGAALGAQVGVDVGQGADADDGRPVGGDDVQIALPQISATDVLEPLPVPDAGTASAVPGVEEPTEELSQDDQDERVVSERDVYDQDDHDVTASAQSGGPGGGVVRRGRVNRGSPIARLSKAKRPGASSQPAGG